MTTLSVSQPATVAASGLARVTAAFRTALARQRAPWTTANELCQLSDHQLRDIGLSRDSVAGAAERAVRDTAPFLLLR